MRLIKARATSFPFSFGLALAPWLCRVRLPDGQRASSLAPLLMCLGGLFYTVLLPSDDSWVASDVVSFVSCFVLRKVEHQLTPHLENTCKTASRASWASHGQDLPAKHHFCHDAYDAFVRWLPQKRHGETPANNTIMTLVTLMTLEYTSSL